MITITRLAKRATRATVAVALAAGLALTGLQPASADADQAAAQQYRPYVHFSPEKNWMNDPNGLVYYKGLYHLYFQYNPQGTRWGNMSWGHATSKDLVHWEQQPLAIPQTFNAEGVPTEDIFSGSVVVDKNNTSGFGTADTPPLVAIYTSAYTAAHPTYAGLQAQSLAYSLDDGQTWTKYSGNPVLNRTSANHRDPKVFWYDKPGGGGYWVMVTVEATEHRVLLYKSSDLKDWTELSDFGPANSTAGIWECPDLFPLKVAGTGKTKWVMIVNLNPGAVAGGSGGQYFVGDFDGTTFTSESTVSAELPPGTTFAGFDNGTYDGWTVNNEPGNRFNGPWTDAPATGAMAGQSPVTGFVGNGLINGFADADWPLGTIESPTFTVTEPYLNFLVGGGNHPHVDGSQNGNAAPAGQLLFDGFEYPGSEQVTAHGWTVTGGFELGQNPSTTGGEFYLGDKRINTFDGGTKGDDNVGTLTSSAFTIDDDYLSFLVGGGRRTDGSLAVQLLVGDDVVRTVSGDENGRLNWKHFDVSDLRGQTARLRINDQATGGWGHLTFDHPVLGPEPAQVRSEETSVNLVVDGEVVRSATGSDSETLDWASWDLRTYAGQQAKIVVIDQNRWGWGHILADQFMFSDESAPTRLEAYDWLDWGRDYYATVSFGNVPDGKRLTIGWMNNWQYAGAIPTSTWRSSMTLPRELGLVETAKGPRLIQHAVDQVASLYKKPSLKLGAQRVSGSKKLAVKGDVVQIDATFAPGSADKFGLSVFGNGDSKTLIGYDTESKRLYVDRRNSGNVDFHPAFASIEDAPVALRNGKLKLRLFLDRASVEVFAQDGRTTITDQVFPLDGAKDLGLFAEGGTAQLKSLKVTPLSRILDDTPPTVTCDVAGPGPQLVAGRSARISASVRDAESGPVETSVSVKADTTSLGATTVNLTGADRAGHTTTIACPYTVVAGAPNSMSVVSGSGQSAAAGSAFAQPLQVKVTDARGNPVAGTTVTFAAPTSGASGSFLSGPTVLTDASGMAAVSVTANTKVGSWQATAKVAGVSSTAGFKLTNTPAPAKKADLGLELSGPSSLKTGESSTFTIKVTNLGPDTAADVVTTAALPSSGLKITKVSGSSVRIGGLVAWSKVATLAKGQVQTYTVTATATSKGTWSTAAGAGSLKTGDPKPSNNVVVRTVTVR